MENITRADVKQVLSFESNSEDRNIIIENASTDSRTVKAGDVFFALIGDKVNGHQFIDEVLRKKAGAVVVIPKYLPPKLKKHPAIITVPDTEDALLTLTRYYRQKFTLPFVGITGSTGKTTTKEILAALLSEKFQVLKSPGNLNTEIGLPLALLTLKQSHQVGVLEMGAQSIGDIALLTDLLRPMYGIVTNVGSSHLEFFKTKENVALEKQELIKNLPPNGFAVLNADDPLVSAMAKETKAHTIFYGIKEKVEVTADGIEIYLFQTRLRLNLGSGEDYEISLPLSGYHNVYNFLAAAAAAKALGLTIEQILAGIKKLKPLKQRQEIIVRRGLTIINDTYNANPDSMQAALEFLSQLDPGRRKLAVLGDMLELGEVSEAEHSRLGEKVAAHNFNLLYTYGEKAALINKTAIEKGMAAENSRHFSDKEALVKDLKKEWQSSDIILLKGSRGMALETVVEDLQNS